MADNTTNRDDSVGEEIAATGQRVKGAVKDVTGSMLGLDRMEREGERENAEGRARQAANDALGDDRVTTRDTSGRLVTGLYESPAHAGRAYQDLTRRHGYTSEDVSVLMSDETRARHFGNAAPGKEFETHRLTGGRRQPKAQALAAPQASASERQSARWLPRRRPLRFPASVSSSQVRLPARSPALAPAAPRARSWAR